MSVRSLIQRDRPTVWLTCVLLSVCIVGPAAADSITLFNTGLDGSGNLAAAGSVDLHYMLVSSTNPNFPGPSAQVEFNLPAGYPADGPASQWIGPVANDNIAGDAGQGTYDYRTTFDLTGLLPTTAEISGQWATDNLGSDILINGISTGQQITSSTFDFHFVNFSITQGFVPGINTLDFITYNAGGPMGLRVEMSGAAAAAPAPKAVWAGLVLLCFCFAWDLRHRQNSKRWSTC